MFVNALAALLTILPATSVLGGQIPVVNGILGGVRTNHSSYGAVKERISLSGEATTPGKLRYVNNSGICETNKGVNWASRFGDLTTSESIL